MDCNKYKNIKNIIVSFEFALLNPKSFELKSLNNKFRQLRGCKSNQAVRFKSGLQNCWQNQDEY